ncbi:unnamed protein product [Caenorhabditis angaria]|uniref:PAP-associated domain-containing protein n=1 Tax=Caenorhabditis angaria TaxID=860376 RepID=A0A9P1I6E4_9PELO|nr:unnamed protein product [Caenorhabditis angaria]
MSRKRNRGQNQQSENSLYRVVRTIGYMNNHGALFTEAEMGKRQGNKPDNLGKFKRRLCFTGIPAAILSSQAVAHTVAAADEACCHAFIDNLKVYLPQKLVRPLFTARPDVNSPDLTNVKVFFEEIEELMKMHSREVGRLSQYEMTAVAREIGTYIRQELKKNLINKHGLISDHLEKSSKKSEPTSPISQKNGSNHLETNSKKSGSTTPISQKSFDQEIIDVEDDNDDVIFVDNNLAGPSEEPVKVSCIVENLRKEDLERKAHVEKNMDNFRRTAMDLQLKSPVSPGYYSPQNALVDFGKMRASKKGPPAIWSQARESSSRQEFVDDSNSSDSSPDEDVIPEKRRKLENDNDTSQMTLNLNLSEVSNDSEYVEEMSLIDEWNEDEDEESEERAGGNTEGEDEYLEEVEEEKAGEEQEEELKVNNETRKSISEDEKKVKKDFGVDLKKLYDGEESLEALEKRWPKNYERCLIGVVYNEKLARCVENIVCQIAEKSDKYVSQISQDTWKHYERNTQNRQVYQKKMDARGKLFEHIQKIFPEKQLAMHVTGSSINGCGSFNSDIDLCLCFPTTKHKGSNFDDFGGLRTESLKVLRRIERQMRRPHPKSFHAKLVNRCELISAKVPIIKMYLKQPFADLDIDINVNNIAGIYNSHLLHYYSQIDGRFVSMALLIKHWAIRNEINDAMSGTLNSYSLILLVVHFLQCGVRPAVLPNLQHLFPDKFDARLSLDQLNLFGEIIDRLPVRPPNLWSVGELLIGFFNYYANFNFSKTAISIRSGQAFERSTLTRDTDFYQIFIEEPFDAVNTARCVRRGPELNRIKKAFKAAAAAFNNPKFDLSDIQVAV